MFDTPREVTLDELAVEPFFPADDRTDPQRDHLAQVISCESRSRGTTL